MSQSDKSKQTTQRISNIESYLKAGFALFPVKIVINKDGKETKMPALGKGNSWTDVIFNPDLEPSSLGSMFGVVLQSDDLVIDADPKRFPKGQNSLLKFWDDLNLPKPINTFVVNTMNGGSHIYFKKPSGIDVIRNLEKLYPGIEIKSKGQFVVGCGSYYKDRSYSLNRGSLESILDAPQTLLDFAKRPDASLRLTADTENEDAVTIDRYIDYLITTPPAIEGKMGDTTTYQTACMGRDFGLSESMTYELMLEHFNPRCEPPWDAESLSKKVEYAYRYAKNSKGARTTAEQDFADYVEQNPVPPPEKPKEREEPRLKFQSRADAQSAKKNQLEPTLANGFYLFMLDTWKGKPNGLYKLLRYNVFTQKIEFTRRAPWHVQDKKYWTNTDDVMLKLHFSHEKHFEVGTAVCYEIAVAVAQHYQYHPIKEYLESVAWDNVPRLDKLFIDYAGATDNKYHRKVAAITLIGAVKRIYEPGCKFDTMVILEGKQGTGKSSFIGILGGSWYKTIPLDMHKRADIVAKMKEGWIIEIPEMAFLKKAAVEDFKFFLSNATDSERLAYARDPDDYARSSIFFGTYNRTGKVGYLKDHTGNRRFYPVATNGMVEFDKLINDRDQLFAEALYRYRKGELTYIKDEDIIEAAENIQEDRMTKDPFVEIIHEFLNDPSNRDAIPEYGLTFTYIVEHILNVPRSILRDDHQTRVERAMKQLGYRTVAKWYKGRTVKVYEYFYASDI